MSILACLAQTPVAMTPALKGLSPWNNGDGQQNSPSSHLNYMYVPYISARSAK